MNFFSELKRRNVYKVAVAYAVVGWLIMQVAATIVPALHLPDVITTAVVVVTLLGFPIALIIAWAFEMTPDGMKRTENISPDQHIPQWSRRKFAAFSSGRFAPKASRSSSFCSSHLSAGICSSETLSATRSRAFPDAIRGLRNSLRASFLASRDEDRPLLCAEAAARMPEPASEPL